MGSTVTDGDGRMAKGWVLLQVGGAGRVPVEVTLQLGTEQWVAVGKGVLGQGSSRP